MERIVQWGKLLILTILNLEWLMDEVDLIKRLSKIHYANMK